MSHVSTPPAPPPETEDVPLIVTPPVVPSAHTMRLPDGTELFYRAWLPAQASSSRRSLVLFHRGHEHSGRFVDVVEALGLDEDVAIFAWDARGHGRSPGARGYAPGFAVTIHDMDCFVRHVAQVHGRPMEEMVVLAHSVGAVAAGAWVHDYAPPIRALVLCTPALRVRLYVPLALPALRLWQRFRRGRQSFVKSYVKARMLTHDPQQAQRYDADPLIARSIAVNILLEMHDTATRLMDDAGAIRVPTLLLAGGTDWVVTVGAQRRFFTRLGSPLKEWRFFPGMYHDLLHEKDRHLVLAEIRRFIAHVFTHTSPPPPLLEAHQHGYTRDEFDELSRPLPRLSPRRLWYTAQRLGLQTVGRLSQGVRLGWATGFDSGQSLDYVYENQPRGALLLGGLIDYLYLQSVGWRGIRQRKVNLLRLLAQAVQRIRAQGCHVHLLDIAAGPGRYDLELMHNLPRSVITARLHDYRQANLAIGRELAQRMGLDNVIFAEGDAFDAKALAAIAPAPNVAVVSGLYELFPDNAQVLQSLHGLAQALRDGGYLVYTNQPWHPQLEMIARVLKNRQGQPWVMRRRTQQEMDDLVRAAGFEKLDMALDSYGIFTVSLARRVHA